VQLDRLYKILYAQVVKDVVFVGGAGDDLRSFPLDARQRAGYQLYLVQMGLDPSDWKPMPSIGPGCREIRVRAPGAYRVVYVAAIGEAVYVLHCFQKKARQTTKADIDLARQRYTQVTEMARAKEKP
jgi:phage-related protein